jgi:hypothetical protein
MIWMDHRYHEAERHDRRKRFTEEQIIGRAVRLELRELLGEIDREGVIVASTHRDGRSIRARAAPGRAG